MSGNKPPRAALFGCGSVRLSDEERRFFRDADPLGFILFARNIDNPAQVSALVGDLRTCVGREAPVLIDQEGGRVQRLKPPHWPARPAMAGFGRLARTDPDLAKRAAYLNARLIAEDLRALGIDVDCAPVLDVPNPGAHEVIGDRAFDTDPALVAALGRAVIDGLLDGGVLPVIKHIPGHGRARVDSHLDLPIVDADESRLDSIDFAPFRALMDAPWAMTAHVVYTAFDDNDPATSSVRVIEDVIRGRIGFDGVLVSDDLSMKALKGGMAERSRKALAAGCDLVLHCNGEMGEMRNVAEGAGPVTADARTRLDRAEALRAMRLAAAPSLAGSGPGDIQSWLAKVA